MNGQKIPLHFTGIASASRTPKTKKEKKNANNHFRRDVIKLRLLKAWALCYFVWFVVEMAAVEEQRFQIDFFLFKAILYFWVFFVEMEDQKFNDTATYLKTWR